MGTFDVPDNLLRFGRPLAVIGLLIAGALLDHQRGAARSWLHKFGLCLWVFYALLQMVVRWLA
jgi:hypothetical protein